jgi:hypothetical protein
VTSNIVGPVVVTRRTLVDECRDLSLVAETVGKVEPITGDDRRRREDLHRLKIPAGGAVIYRVDAPIDSWEATFFIVDGAANEANLVEAAISSDGVEFTPLTVDATLLDGNGIDRDYGYLPRLALSPGGIASDALFLKLTPRQGVELSHVAIRSKRTSSGTKRPEEVAVKKHGGK